MSNPRISVIVPVYNAEKYLEECVQSILKQTYQNFELILIDDGSPDGCGKICDRFAEIDARIVVCHKKNEGVSIARNTGISLARGEYQSFVDSDDSIDLDFLEAAMTAIQTSGADLYISGLQMETWDHKEIIGVQRYASSETKIYSVKELLEKRDCDYPLICISGPCCKLYKKSVIDDHGVRFSEHLSSGEDINFVLDVLEHCVKAYFSKECFYHYRRGNGESLFNRFHADTYEIASLVYSKMRRIMNECGCSEEAMNAFDGLYFDSMVGAIHEYYRFCTKTTCKERFNQIIKVAHDPYARKIRLCNVTGIKTKIIFLLLKCRMYPAVALLFRVMCFKE